MSRARPRSVALRSRSHLEVKDKKKRSFFCVWSITLPYLNGFCNDLAEIITIMNDVHLVQDLGL